MSAETKIYLGDSVYASWDGYLITLTTENGDGASNTIFLEPQVLDSLIRFVQRLKETNANKKPAI